jgi:hypothetical protein
MLSANFPLASHPGYIACPSSNPSPTSFCGFSFGDSMADVSFSI